MFRAYILPFRIFCPSICYYNSAGEILTFFWWKIETLEDVTNWDVPFCAMLLYLALRQCKTPICKKIPKHPIDIGYLGIGVTVWGSWEWRRVLLVCGCDQYLAVFFHNSLKIRNNKAQSRWTAPCFFVRLCEYTHPTISR